MPEKVSPWTAAFLSLPFGPIGQIYAGRFQRCMSLYLLDTALLALCIIAASCLKLNQALFFLALAVIVGYKLFVCIDAYRVSKQSSGQPRKWYQSLWLCIALMPVFVGLNQIRALLIKTYVAEAFAVPGLAMSPTIAHMDRILVDKFWASPDSVQRGDVIVFRTKERTNENGEKRLFVMRIMGMPGETIEIKENAIYINGNIIEDPHGHVVGTASEITPPYLGPLIIPEDAFYVLGDNRNRANDSRYTGTVHFKDFYGKANIILYSRDYEYSAHDEFASPKIGAMRWDRIGSPIE